MTALEKQNDSAFTKRTCVFGLVMSWFVGMTALVLGAICYASELRDDIAVHLKVGRGSKELLPLFLNIVVTLLNNSMGYIHACALRWALHREGLLEFNSNLRLLRVSKYSRPNGAAANAVCFIGILMSYGSTSLVFLSMKPSLAQLLGKTYASNYGDHSGVHINSIALFTLGIGLISQAFITTWAMGITNIATWSSNPLDVAHACVHDEHDGHRIEPRVGRCMMGVDLAKEDARSIRPRPKQRPMITANFRIKRILALLLVTPIIAAVWGAAAVAYVARYRVAGRSWSLIPFFPDETISLCHGLYCGTSVLNVAWTTTNGNLGIIGGVLLIMAVQAFITVSLQGAELLVNLSRDEEIYRALIEPKGTNGHFNSIWASFTSGKTLLLFFFKAGVHWMFGLAIDMQCEVGVNIYPPQILYLSVFTFFTAIFGLYLSLHQPRGYLPAAYGHIQTIADVIDEWSDSGCMFWGEKDPGDPQRGIPGYTGTSSQRLKEPDERRFYGGQREKNGASVFRRSVLNTPISTVTTTPSSSSTAGATLAPPDWYPLQPIANPGSVNIYTQSTQQQQSPRRQSSIGHIRPNSASSAYSHQSNESTQALLSQHR